MLMAGEAQSSLQTTFRTRSGARLRVEGNAALQLEGFAFPRHPLLERGRTFNE